MNFCHLEYAVAVSKYGSIRKASQILFVSQPYLSGIIKNLENELGYTIFNRTHSGIVLTSEGEEFVKCAKRILLEMKKIREIHMEEEITPLNICSYHAPCIMEQFLKFRASSPHHLPDKIREDGNMEVLESVLSGQTNLGIIFYASEKKEKYLQLASESGLVIEDFFKPMKMYAYLSPNHPLAGQKEVLLSELKNYPFVFYDDASSKKYLELLGIENHTHILEVSDRGALSDAIKSGAYLSVMAYSYIPENTEYIILPFLDKQLFLCSSYVITKNHKLSQREKEFLAFIQK